MMEDEQELDAKALSSGHYLELNEKAWKAWEAWKGEGKSEVRGFLESHCELLRDGDILGIEKRWARDSFECDFRWARILDADTDREHLVVSWQLAREGIQADDYEEASVITLDTPEPRVLARKVDASRLGIFQGKAEVFYFFGDDEYRHTFLDVSGEKVTLIRERKLVKLSRDEARVFIEANLKEKRTWKRLRKALVPLCVSGLFVVMCFFVLSSSRENPAEKPAEFLHVREEGGVEKYVPVEEGEEYVEAAYEGGITFDFLYDYEDESGKRISVIKGKEPEQAGLRRVYPRGDTEKTDVFMSNGKVAHVPNNEWGEFMQALEADGLEIEVKRQSVVWETWEEREERRIRSRRWEIVRWCGWGRLLVFLGQCVGVLVVFWVVWGVWWRLVPGFRGKIGRFLGWLSTPERAGSGEGYSPREVFWHSTALFVVLVGVFFGLACLGILHCAVSRIFDFFSDAFVTVSTLITSSAYYYY